MWESEYSSRPSVVQSMSRVQRSEAAAARERSKRDLADWNARESLDATSEGLSPNEQCVIGITL